MEHQYEKISKKASKRRFLFESFGASSFVSKDFCVALIRPRANVRIGGTDMKWRTKVQK